MTIDRIADFRLLRRHWASALSVGAGICYLMAGQPTEAMAAVEAGPKKLPTGWSDAVKRTGACQTGSMLDRLSNSHRTGRIFNTGESVEAVLAGTDNCPGTALPASNVLNDTGTTLGATSTVSSIPLACNSLYTQVAGPDVVYTFTLPPLAQRAASCTVSLDPTGANWDPSIYILSSAAPGCPAGTANSGTNCVTGADAFGSNGTEVIADAQMDALPAGTYYLFIDSFYSTGALSAGTYALAFNCPSVTAADASVSGRVLTDADGRGLVGATVIIADAQGNTRSTLTTKGGSYTFGGIEAGGTYTITVQSKRYSFNPVVIQVNDNLGDINFIPN